MEIPLSKRFGTKENQGQKMYQFAMLCRSKLAWIDIGWISYNCSWIINQREWLFDRYQYDVNNQSCPDKTSMSWNRSTEISILYYI